MPTPIITEPVTVTPNAIRYPALQFNSRLDAAGNLIVSMEVQLQRAEHREDGTWVDDPSIGARKPKQIANLAEYMQAHQDIAPLILAAWAAIDAAVGAINAADGLV
jgi:hypothetical protein